MQPGSNWAGGYGRWTFDELKQYVLMAKELYQPLNGQGVPLLASELNEGYEILLTLFRRLVKRMFGNGTNNDGFKIIPSASNPVNGFTIKGGDGTAEGAGYIFVAGWMPILSADLEYSAQPNVPSLTTPAEDRVDEVYLDVYLDEVGPVRDPNLIDPNLGFETSRRIQLFWVVRVAEGHATPGPYTDAFGLQHWTYTITTITRQAGVDQITGPMILDQRNEGRAPLLTTVNLGGILGDQGTLDITNDGKIIFKSGDSDAYLLIDKAGLKAFNEDGVQTVHLASDGSGWFGLPNSKYVEWGPDGATLIDGQALKPQSVESISVADFAITAKKMNNRTHQIY